MAPPHAPVFSSLLRYTSGLADAGPNDLQIVWFGGVGGDEASLAGGRIIGAVMRVFSTGVVRLRSPNPRVDPVVEFGMLADERDRDRLRDLTGQMVELVHHPMVASITTAVTALTTPIDELDSDAAIDAWLRANVGDYVHAVGTCRMGARTIRPRSSTPSAGSSATTACACATRRSCPISRRRTRTSRPSRSPNASSS